MHFMQKIFFNLKVFLMKVVTGLKSLSYRFRVYLTFCLNVLYYIITHILIKLVIRWMIIISFVVCYNLVFIGYCNFNEIFELICSYFYNSLCVSQNLIYDETMPNYEILSAKEIYKSWEDDGIIRFVHDENFEERAEICRNHYRKEKVYLDDRFYMVLIPYFFVLGLFGLWFFLAFLETGSLTLEDPILVAKTLEASLRARESGWETVLRLFPEYLMLKERKDRTEVLVGLAEFYLKKLETVREDLLLDEVEQFRVLRYVTMFWHLEIDRIEDITENVLQEQYEAEFERFVKLQEGVAEAVEKNKN